jgi:hypothetical protein
MDASTAGGEGKEKANGKDERKDDKKEVRDDKKDKDKGRSRSRDRGNKKRSVSPSRRGGRRRSRSRSRSRDRKDRRRDKSRSRSRDRKKGDRNRSRSRSKGRDKDKRDGKRAKTDSKESDKAPAPAKSSEADADEQVCDARSFVCVCLLFAERLDSPGHLQQLCCFSYALVWSHVGQQHTHTTHHTQRLPSCPDCIWIEIMRRCVSVASVSRNGVQRERALRVLGGGMVLLQRQGQGKT